MNRVIIIDRKRLYYNHDHDYYYYYYYCRSPWEGGGEKRIIFHIIYKLFLLIQDE